MTSASLAVRCTLAAVAGASFLLAGCRSAPPWLQNGMVAPEIEGSTVDGQRVRLSEQRGKVVAVIFFTDMCPYCRGQLPTERELAKRMDTHPFTILAVDTSDQPDDIRAMIRREKITWPVIDDFDGSNATAWGVALLPTIYVIDASGVIRSFDERGSSLVGTVDELLAEMPANGRM